MAHVSSVSVLKYLWFLHILFWITTCGLTIVVLCLFQVGRSGRFGHLGLAVNLITYEDRFNLYVELNIVLLSSIRLLIPLPLSMIEVIY